MQEAPFDMLIHCGDVEGREIFIEALTECPCHIVSGNNDFFSDLPREEIVEAGNNRIFVTHGHYYGVSMDITGVIDEAKDRGCNAVFFGHTHKPIALQKNGVFLFNPGSCGRCYTGPNTYGVMLLDKGKITSFAHKEVPQQ